MGPARVTTSVSTWQPAPVPPASPVRAALLARIARTVVGRSPGRVRVVLDGRAAAGKSTCGHELAERIAALGRPVLRASLDDFKRPWAERHAYDRASGPGFYRNAFDHDAIRRLLLDPAASDGSGRVVLCARDPHTQVEHADVVDDLGDDGILLVDGVFAFRPELDDAWDLRIWLEVTPEVALERGVRRDTPTWSGADPVVLHRDRYGAAEDLYLRQVDPLARADVVVDNVDPAAPRLLRG